MVDVVIKIKKKEIRLTEEEARTLYAELECLFGAPRFVGPFPPFSPVEPYVSPTTESPPRWPTITCETDHVA